LIDTHEREWVLRYNRTAVEFPKENDISRCPARNSGVFSSPTWGRTHTRTREHDKNDTLKTTIMADIRLYFKTKRRNQEKIDKEAHLMYEVLTRHSQKVLYAAYSNSLIIFNVYKLDAIQRISLLNDVSIKLLADDRFQGLDLTYYSII
jgi:hypothetical protein